MTNDKKYNGWTNWETWNCNLHFDGNFEEEAHRFYNEAESDKTFTKKENAALALKDYIKESVKEYAEYDVKVNPFIQDMINGYLSEVNFYEIAKAYIESVAA